MFSFLRSGDRANDYMLKFPAMKRKVKIFSFLRNRGDARGGLGGLQACPPSEEISGSHWRMKSGKITHENTIFQSF